MTLNCLLSGLTWGCFCPHGLVSVNSYPLLYTDPQFHDKENESQTGRANETIFQGQTVECPLAAQVWQGTRIKLSMFHLLSTRSNAGGRNTPKKGKKWRCLVQQHHQGSCKKCLLMSACCRLQAETDALRICSCNIKNDDFIYIHVTFSVIFSPRNCPIIPKRNNRANDSETFSLMWMQNISSYNILNPVCRNTLKHMREKTKRHFWNDKYTYYRIHSNAGFQLLFCVSSTYCVM